MNLVSTPTELALLAKPNVTVPEQNSEASVPPEQEFKPTLQFWLAFIPIAVLAMMVSLDGTSVSVALPVSCMILAQFPSLMFFLLLDHGR
jgi:hypothetical protein